MDEKEIRSFLVAQPRGATIRVRTADDEIRDVAAPNGKGVTWAHVARSVAALEHVYIELLDAEGKLLRATKTTGDRAEATPSAKAPPVIHTDPEAARLITFASLLSDAYRFSTEVAFTKMVELAQQANERTMALETRLERTEANYRREMQTRLDEAFDDAETAKEEAERIAREAQQAQPNILETFAAGLANGRSAAPPPPVTNGKKS